MTDSILYFDLETDKKTGKINDVGAHYKGKDLHEKSLEKLKSWIEDAKYLCGHNIVNHDIPILIKQFGEIVFQNKIILDTLLWSPILFAKNPYHKLVKGYKIVNDKDYNNPLSDSKLTKELLIEEVEEFRKIDNKLKEIYYHLLSKNAGYNGLFKILKINSNGISLLQTIKEHFKDEICQNASLSHYISNHKEALSYALALLDTKDGISVCAPWVNKTYPVTQTILDTIRFNTCNDPNCNYCRSKLNPKKALKKYFGFEHFRKFEYDRDISLQEKTVRAGMQSQSFVAVFPTGGGKSLTFQLPALMKGDLARQLTVVISPLVSLMKDQVDVLQQRHGIVKAVAINGLLSPLERKEAIEKVSDGSAHILYISPESLRSRTILKLLKNRSIARFVIDEAHCFSSWGQDFRVDYLYIGTFIKQLQNSKLQDYKIPVSCFTATAKPQVVQDIKNYFKERLDINLVEFITRAERKNLEYKVINIEDPKEKPKELIKLLNQVETPVIIYVSRVKKVEELRNIIEKIKIPVTGFHGKMERDEKLRNQEAFMNEEVDIIVATSAFGMGIDKDNVKTVIHYDISDSLENYIQEAGRAGREKEISAKCYILFHEDDLNKHFSLLQQTKINHKEIDQIWRAIKGMTKFREKISNSALEIAQRAGWNTEIRELENKVKSSIAALEDQKFLERTQNSPRIFADSLLVRNLDRAVKIVNERKNLTERQKNNCARLLQRLVKDDESRVDYLADTLDLKIKEIQETITLLRDIQLLGDNRDLTAFIDIRKSKLGSRKILQKFLNIEKKLIESFTTKKLKISLRQLNQKMIDEDVPESTCENIKILLNYWDHKNFISKTRIDRQNELYEIKLKVKRELINEDIELRHDIAVSCFQNLEEKYKIQSKKFERNRDIPVQFSLLELKKEIEGFSTASNLTIKAFEQALLYLNQIKVIKLEGGFMVIYNRLNINRIEKSTKRRFTIKDYIKLKEHYEHKTQQIHIIGEYAKKSIENYQDALRFTNSYFTQPYDEFIKTYFPKRKAKITRAMTDSKFERLFGALDLNQKKIVDDNKSDNILVSAGPGSGKTRILVHKIASLLLIEDIKPEQFLMLTFSKAAALEFRSRIYKIVPEYGRLIKIATFHGFAFELLGQLGDLKKSEHIIQECIDVIKKEEIDISSITNKSVLVLDEFQDVAENEWELIKLIKEKAQNLRIIAVGDDDQSIYEFRGASIKHMYDFKENFNATTYSLLTNYRSRPNLVQFNNEFLKTIQERIKKDEILNSILKENGKIEITEYRSKYFYEQLVDDIIKTERYGSTAVLTRKNDEALFIATLLKAKGIKVKLIAGTEGFKLNSLYEIRYFQELLKKEIGETSFISKDHWKKSIDIFNKKFQNNPLKSLCEEILNHFENLHNSYFEIFDWFDYINQINTEDAIHPDTESVIVSTMHKSKGKEFDSVYLYLSDYNFTTDIAKRLIYVASTRAKENICIHCNNSFFNTIHAEDRSYTISKEETSSPDHFEYILNHKEINLGSQKFSRDQIRKLKTGDKLKFGFKKFADNDAPGLINNEGINVLLFSKSFIETKYNNFKNSGYKIKDAIIEYIVFWYDQTEEKEYRIVLPRLRFEKK